MTAHATDPRPMVRVDDVSAEEIRSLDQFDRVVVEAPLAITVGEQTLVTTMRTPGHDEELAVGWLISESAIATVSEITRVERVGASELRDWGVEEAVDTVLAELAPGVEPPQPRAYLTSSSCGVCSSDVLTAAAPQAAPLQTAHWSMSPKMAHQLIDAMRVQQKMFDLTGSLHGAALAPSNGEILVVREDVGRHNAVDKVIGHAYRAGVFPLTDHILVVSGRVSYEIVAKAVRAGIAAIVAVSGPTTLAVDMARAKGLVLIGFTRDDRLNIYSGKQRVSA